jgi:hypothetical protein
VAVVVIGWSRASDGVGDGKSLTIMISEEFSRSRFGYNTYTQK